MSDLGSAFSNLRKQPDAGADSFGNFAIDGGRYPTDMLDGLAKMGLLAKGDHPRITPIDNSLTSDLNRVELVWGSVFVKRALPRLKAGSKRRVPVERSAFERLWLKTARAVVGESVPEILGEHPDMFAMEYLDPDVHAAWDTLLDEGEVNPSLAAEAGRLIGRIHAATANNFAVAERFDSDRIFHAARIEPLFLAAAEAVPEAALRLRKLAATTAKTKIALVHGDLCPENFLVGPRGPVLLDAEYARYGDPSFDVAFCLARLLLNCVWRPQCRDGFLTSFDAFCATYGQRITWEIPERLDERAARLVPALILGRVLDEAPIKQLPSGEDKKRVAGIARRMLLNPVVRLAAVRETWRRALLD